jgi:branched-chain amino acid transport system permease protein
VIEVTAYVAPAALALAALGAYASLRRREARGLFWLAVAAVAFALGVATTGAGGSLISVLYPFFPASHYQWISRLLGVIVLGGMGSLPGAVAGALLMGVGETMTTAYISPQWQTAVPYVVIFVVLLLRPQGLLGTRTRGDVVTT